MAYMMAGEDEEERNKVLTDDPARWVRNARFNTGIEVAGRDLVIQQAWGFGNGALRPQVHRLPLLLMVGKDS
jgi:hypothetical protein